jgi:hypothetical protein
MGTPRDAPLDGLRFGMNRTRKFVSKLAGGLSRAHFHEHGINKMRRIEGGVEISKKKIVT